MTWIRRRVSFTVPQLAAAAVVTLLLGSAVVIAALRQTAPGPVAGQRTIEPLIVPVATPRLDAAVAELEQALREGRGRLDSTTVRVIEQSLALIDAAIGEAQAALDHDPANAFLNRHLTNQKLRKLQLLRRAHELAATSST